MKFVIIIYLFCLVQNKFLKEKKENNSTLLNSMDSHLKVNNSKENHLQITVNIATADNNNSELYNKRVISNLEEKGLNLEKLSFSALQRISEGLAFLADDTSCKVAGKYILLTAANIKREDDRNHLNLTGEIDEDIQSFKNYLKQGKILQIEFFPNHHIILFARNQTHLYELQAFQNVYQLKDWMRNLENMKPKDMDIFFNKVKNLLNKVNDKETFNGFMLDLFMPNYFIEETNKIEAMKKWFSSVNFCTIKKAEIADYDFSNDPLDPLYFLTLFNDVDNHLLLRVQNYS